MRQMSIAILAVMFLFLGHGKAFSDPIGIGMDEATKEYGDYTKAVRIKIGNNMSKKLDMPEEGTVSLNFIISSAGELIQVNVINDETKASPRMISTAVMAVKQSAPFDPFPAVLARGNSKLPFTINLGLKPAK